MKCTIVECLIVAAIGVMGVLAISVPILIIYAIYILYNAPVVQNALGY